MAFCRNCGAEIISGAKFCPSCGCAFSAISTNLAEQQPESSPKLYSCPGCGKILNSFMLNCPACGLELRGIKASNAIREFAMRLEAIETQRYAKRKGLFAKIGAGQTKAQIREQKILLIQSFPIPNTKEDTLEFLILAISNIDASLFGKIGETNEDVNAKALAKAWLSKAKQAYLKAQEICSNDAELQQINRIYNECIKEIRRQKALSVCKWILVFSSPFIFVGLIFLLTHLSGAA